MKSIQIIITSVIKWLFYISHYEESSLHSQCWGRLCFMLGNFHVLETWWLISPHIWFYAHSLRIWCRLERIEARSRFPLVETGAPYSFHNGMFDFQTDQNQSRLQQYEETDVVRDAAFIAAIWRLLGTKIQDGRMDDGAPENSVLGNGTRSRESWTLPRLHQPNKEFHSQKQPWGQASYFLE